MAVKGLYCLPGKVFFRKVATVCRVSESVNTIKQNLITWRENVLHVVLPHSLTLF